MKNLSNEVKLDIFKYLNFNQLNVIQQTNKSFCGIVDRYKTELARKEVFALEIDWKYYVCKQVKCSSKSLHFQLNPDTKAKWNDALKQQIPLFISQPEEIHEDEFDEAVNLFILFIYKDNNNKLPPKILHLQLKRYPKNIEELFFVRYWLEQLSSCYFENIKIKQAIFNPKIIDLLFDGSPPLQFYTKYFYLFGGYLNATFEFIYHHLKIFEPKGFYFEDTVGTLRGEIIKEEEKYLKIDQQNCQNIKEGKECSGENCEGCKDNNSYVVTKGEGKLFKSVEYEFYNIYVPNTLFHMLLIISVEDKKVLQIFLSW